MPGSLNGGRTEENETTTYISGGPFKDNSDNTAFSQINDQKMNMTRRD